MGGFLWKSFSKMCIFSACGWGADERRLTFGHSEVWKARRNQEYLEAPETFWKLGMWELRRLLSSSSVSLGRCFARSGPICSAHCATRSAGPWSLPVNISTSDFYQIFLFLPHSLMLSKYKNLLQQLVRNLSEESVNVVAAFGRSLQKIHPIPAKILWLL